MIAADGQVKKLRQFLAIAMALGGLFALGHAVVWRITGDDRFGLVSLDLCAYLSLVLLVWRALSPHNLVFVAQVVAYGLLGLVGLGGYILPLGSTAAVLGCIVAVALALPLLSGARLAALCWAASAVVTGLVIAGKFAPTRPMSLGLLLYGSVGPALAFSFLVVWLLYDFAAGERRMRSEADLARDLALRERESMAFLSEASRRLSSALDYPTALRALAQVAVPELADYCVVIEAGAQGPRWAAGAHRDPRQDGALERHTRRELEERAHPLRRALEEGELTRIEQLPRAQTPDALGGLAPRSLVALPLVARGRRLGALLLAMAESERRFSAEKLGLVEEFANRASIALDNARLYRQLAESLRARDEFLSIASHELRTPLTPLKLYARLMLREVDSIAAGGRPRAWLEHHLNAILRQCDRQERLIQELLDLGSVGARQAELTLRAVDWGQVLSSVVQDLEDVGDLRNYRSTLKAQVAGPVVGRWDRARLQVITKHLVLNALKYGAGRPVEVRLDRAGSSAELSVVDHGIGIAPEDQQRVFEPFERAVSARHFGGLGLGLFLVRRSAKALGGEVEMKSSPGSGSTFRVRLPLEGPPVQPTPAVEAELPAN